VAKRRVDPLDFPFGANVAPKRARAKGAKGGKKPRTGMAKEMAIYYLGKKGRR
jgi:hypothetical protein